MSFVVTSNGNTVTFPTTFYDYEPFKYSFSNTNSSNISVSGTYLLFFTGSGTPIVTIDRSSNGFLTPGSTSGETVIMTAGASTVTFKLFIYNGRFQLTPPLQSIVLYQNEPMSITLANLGYPGLTGISFASATTLTIVPYTSPTLPSSLLTLTNPTGDYRTFLLSGSSPLLSASSNYYFVGSNSSNGFIVTTQFGIQVAGERMTLVPSSSSNVITLSTPITPITFSCYVPISVTGPVLFTASNLPPGLGLSAASVVPVSNVATVSITGTPTYLSSGATSYSTNLVAKALGVSVLTASSAVSFSYTQSIIADSPQTISFFSNIAGSYQVIASVFPTPTPITYSLDAPVAGLSLSSSGLLTGTISSNVVPNITASALGTTSRSIAVEVTAAPVVVVVTPSPSSLSGYVGQTIPVTTLTFSSAAYPSGNFIASNGVTISGLPAGLASSWVYPSLTATIFGTIYSPGSSGSITITVTTINGALSSSSLPYTFLNDTCVFSTVTPSPFVFTQNRPITPITFTGAPRSGLPLAFYYATGLPGGLYVSPGGIVQGSPSTVVSNQPFGTIRATTGNKLADFLVTSPSTYFYTVLPDSALLFASPPSYAVNVSSSVPTITISNLTVSGLKLSNTYYDQGVLTSNVMVFTSYSYGITATPVSISGTLGTGVYPTDVVIPASVALTGTLSPGAIPAVFGLSNLNPQVINRFIAGYSGTSYTIFNDSGTYDFSPIYTQVSPGLHNFQIISNATSTLSSWSGSLVLADGTPDSAVSTSVSPPVFSFADTTSKFIDCIYSSTLNSWIAYSDYNNGALYFSSNATSPWSFVLLRTQLGSTQPSVTPIGNVKRGNVIEIFGTTLLLGGSGSYPLMYANLSSIPTTTVTLTNIVSPAIVADNSVYDIAINATLVVAAGIFANGKTLLWSSNGINWTAGTGGFSSSAVSVVHSALPALGWFAIGNTDTSSPGVAWSADGKAWTQIPFGFSGVSVGPAQFDGTYWSFFVSTGTTGVFTLYQHDALVSNIADITTWTTRTILLPGMTSVSSFPVPIYTIVGVPQPVVFVGATVTGPAFTSPTVMSYHIYQYVPIADPIVFAATPPAGKAVVYFLASPLPPGMVWNPLATSSTATIEGLSVQLGTFNVSVYAQSSNGISLKTIQVVVSRLPIIPTLPSAAEYTSYLREKVTADAATSAVNNHTTPFEVGTFALERPPAVTLAPELCCDTNQFKNIR